MADYSAFDETWSNPPAIYRGAPFWSWNARLDPQRLQDEVQSMHDSGLGGFFMHSRYGLKTPYLSDEWFECVSACVEKGRELQMRPDLYDEDRWPSGPAGGIVTRNHPEYRIHYLEATMEDAAAVDDALAVFDVKFNDGGKITSYTRLEDPAEADGRVMVFRVHPQEPSGWTNDGGYLDTMNPDAVAEFIRVTHEAYAERYGDDFGSLIPSIFTDEPSLGAQVYRVSDDHRQVPWTGRIPQEFSARFGYDLLDHLPEITYQVADSPFSRPRQHYHRLIGELFVEAFTQQIGQWCGEHDIALTGHMLSEQTLVGQCHASGSVMQHYEHMQWPGIDNLRDQNRELTTAKQCSSVASQLAKERMLSELYGCTGWDWPLEGHKFVGDWQFACGVNFRCPHLSHYSLAGGAKRDYPASILHHSPWWDYYNAVEDYFGRLAFMLTQGRAVRDVLLIHPVETAWGLLPGEKNAGHYDLQYQQDTLDEIIYALSGQHHDWDYGDEALLQKYATVQGDRLSVGEMEYQLVIVPPAVTLRDSTVQLLDAFIQAGGEVLFIGDPPDLVDGEPSDAAHILAGAAHTATDERPVYMAAVDQILDRRVSITCRGRQDESCWIMLREIEAGQILFIDTHEREKPHRVHVSVRAEAPVILWDALTGEKTRIRTQEIDGHMEFDLTLDATGSALLSFGMDVPDAQDPVAEPEVIETQEIAGPYDIELTEPNTMPLDYCEYRVGDEDFSDTVPTLKADEQIRARYGLGTRLGREHQPWYLYATGAVDTAERDRCQLRRTFHITEVPASCHLAMEGPEDFRVSVNGSEISEVDGWWVDEDIKTLDIADHLVAGDNEIVLTFDYRPDMEIENMYLVGDFGVECKGDAPTPDNMTMVAAPDSVDTGSWVGQGLDFYGGAVEYVVTVPKPGDGQRCRVKMPEVSATCVAVHVGDETAVLPWAPFEADITDWLQPGDNEVRLEILGGRKNILGPLHTEWEESTGPGSFDPNNPGWRYEYYLSDHGLMAPVIIETLEAAD
ncbi:MAG: glycosyl hydrolase [Armatimonadota bacterium]